MSWDLSSVVSRFRRPVRRQPTPEPPSQDTMPQLQREPFTQRLPIGRNILQDPSSFLDAETQDVLPLGLTPSTRLPSADGSSNTRSRPRPTDLSSKPLSELSELPPGSSVDISPRTQSRFTISKFAAGGEWSTFGRKRKRVSDVAGLAGCTSPPDSPKRTSHSPSPVRDNKHLSADSNSSMFTMSRLTNPSRPSSSTRERHSSPSSRSPRQSPDIRFSYSKASTPANTMSSKRHPRTPQRPPSHTTPATSSVMTPANRELDLDSPHTFGHLTPPNNPVDSSVPYPSPPPPLPSLDHPELTTVLFPRRKSTTTGQPILSAFRDRSNTLPTNRHPPRKDDLFASLSLKLRRSARHQSSVPQAKQVFNTAAMTEQHETGPLGAPEGHRRARTVSGGARGRRTSADWSSYQASVGVNSHANQAWPAEVSREILRLSLTESIPGSSAKRKPRTRGRSTDPVRRPDRGVMSPSFLPFPHPSQPTSPPPSTASATLPGQPNSIYLAYQYFLTPESHSDGWPSRSQSLRFDLENRRGSEQPGRFKMTGVKRSLSAIETLNGRNNGASGVAYTSLGLSDPAPTSSEAPQASRLFHASSTPTPSRSLFSGRISPTNTPMSSSMQGEPSTPTPAPRQRSDKSRGKRKAEENIDITPPEQKKEGQRATFLLPSESRSKCHPLSGYVSNRSIGPCSN